MPAQNLIEFIIYIAPGFIAREIYYSYYPRRKKSDFAQITWSLIYGVSIFATVALVDKYLFNYDLCSNSNKFPNFKLTAVLFLGGILLSFILIGVHKLRQYFTRDDLQRKILGLSLCPNFQTIWEKINHVSNGDWAVVYLSDNSIYRGWIKEYNDNPNSENQDFLLADAERVNDSLNKIYVVSGKGLYLNTRDVIRIEFLKGEDDDN